LKKKLTQEQAISEGYTVYPETGIACRPAGDASETVLLYTETEALLISALKRMISMHSAMFSKTNVGASFYDADTLREMNEAPLEARRLLAKLEANS